MVAVDNVYVALDEACTLLPSLKNSYALTSDVVDAQVKITFAPSTGEALFDVSVGVAGLSGEKGQNHLLNIKQKLPSVDLYLILKNALIFFDCMFF